MRTFRQFRRASVTATTGGVKISELPVATAANANDQIEINQGGTSRSLALQQITSARSSPITFNVATTGGDANDGSAASPVATFQKALDLCAATAAYSPGPFTIQAAPGTYTSLVALAYDWWLFVGSPVTFIGARDGAGIPTVVIQGSTDATRTHNFLRATHNVRFYVQDIKFISFGAVFASSHGAEANLTNCHTRNCGQLGSLGNMGWGSAWGGDIDGRDLDGVMIENSAGWTGGIGSFWNLEQPPGFITPATLKIHHVHRGVVGAEMFSGHMDVLWIEDCDIGVEFTRGSGAPNMSGIRIWRCGVGLLGRNTPNLEIADHADFGQGTANACLQNVVLSAGSTGAQVEDTNYDSRVVYKRAQGLGSMYTGDIVEHVVWPVFYLVRGRMRERDLVAQFNIPGQTSGIVGLAAAATLRFKIGATTFVTATLPIACRTFTITGTLSARNSTDFLGDLVLTTWNGTNATVTPLQVGTQVGAVSLTAETLLSLTMTLGNAADTFQLRGCHVFSSVAGITGSATPLFSEEQELVQCPPRR